MMYRLRHLVRFAGWAAVGIALGLSVLAGFGLVATNSRATSPYSPVWVLSPFWNLNLANWTTLSGCSDWKSDNGYFPPGPPTTYAKFSDYWSGKPAYWNLPSAHGCWHNDEQSSSWWRAIDYPASAGTTIRFRSEVNGSSQWAATYFDTAGGCPGVKVDVYTPNGQYAGTAHYWHMTAATGLVGTWGTTNVESFPLTKSYRNIGTVLSHGSDSCTNTGDHVHQAVLQGGWAQPNKEGSVEWGPMSFGW